MAVKDIKNNLLGLMALLATIVSDTTTQGVILDTADFELGLMFTLSNSLYTDGTYTLLLEESDDSGMAGATTIAGEQLIGSLPVVSAATVQSNSAALGSVGVISNKRFVRASIVSTATTSGATVAVLATQKGEVLPIS